jgi:hypothetical protein
MQVNCQEDIWSLKRILERVLARVRQYRQRIVFQASSDPVSQFSITKHRVAFRSRPWSVSISLNVNSKLFESTRRLNRKRLRFGPVCAVLFIDLLFAVAVALEKENRPEPKSRKE